MRTAFTSTANNSKVGETIAFLVMPYKGDLRLYWEDKTISSIELTKTGKRVVVKFEDGTVVKNIAPNTPFSESPREWLRKIGQERGWRKGHCFMW